MRRILEDLGWLKKFLIKEKKYFESTIFRIPLAITVLDQVLLINVVLKTSCDFQLVAKPNATEISTDFHLKGHQPYSTNNSMHYAQAGSIRDGKTVTLI
jgi:hypothetical protein